jgi:NAD(P)H-flavin reductase/hemoglobin-like flavoprotein
MADGVSLPDYPQPGVQRYFALSDGWAGESMDPGRLKENFKRVAEHGDQIALFFYSDLFLRYPETRELFPVSMAVQRDRLLQALGTIVASADRIEEIAPFIQELGRDHRKFGALADHYGPVGESLLATLAHFSGPDWTPELAQDWSTAYQVIAKVMIDAALEDARHRPAFWDATVVTCEQRSFDIAVMRVRTSEPMAYQPGQSVAVQSPRRPRTWRFFSMANAPREDATVDFHIQMLDGGMVSMPLVRQTGPGDSLRLGPPVGTFTLRESSQRDRPVLLVAGGTGLAPLKALAEQLAGLDSPPPTTLFFGARSAEALYDLADLEKLSAGASWLTLTPCVSGDPGYPGERGTLPDVVARSGAWRGHDVYLAGPTPMIEVTTERLTSLGAPPDRIYAEDFGWSMT